ncbi:MAG: hypothetical protein ACUVRV_07530 [Cyanobacteriota bacterium]
MRRCYQQSEVEEILTRAMALQASRGSLLVQSRASRRDCEWTAGDGADWLAGYNSHCPPSQ